MTADSLRIYIGYVDEIRHVSTSEMRRRYRNSETNEDEKNQGSQKWKLNLGHHKRKLSESSL